MVCSPLRTKRAPEQAADRPPSNPLFKGVHKPNGRSPFVGRRAVPAVHGDTYGESSTCRSARDRHPNSQQIIDVEKFRAKRTPFLMHGDEVAPRLRTAPVTPGTCARRNRSFERSWCSADAARRQGGCSCGAGLLQRWCSEEAPLPRSRGACPADRLRQVRRAPARPGPGCGRRSQLRGRAAPGALAAGRGGARAASASLPSPLGAGRSRGSGVRSRPLRTARRSW